MSGYEIKKNIENSVGNFWSESYGQLYPQLKLLREEGLTRAVEGADDAASKSGRGGKKIYAITEKGREFLANWLKQAPAQRPLRVELLLKIFFASANELDAIGEHCRNAGHDARRNIKEYEDIIGRIEDIAHEGQDNERLKFAKLTLDYGIEYNKFLTAWCDKAGAQLEGFANQQVAADGQ